MLIAKANSMFLRIPLAARVAFVHAHPSSPLSHYHKLKLKACLVYSITNTTWMPVMSIRSSPGERSRIKICIYSFVREPAGSSPGITGLAEPQKLHVYVNRWVIYMRRGCAPRREYWVDQGGNTPTPTQSHTHARARHTHIVIA